MNPGKIASQAGHAFLGAFLASLRNPSFKAQAEQYADEAPGTKVALGAKHEGHIDLVCDEAERLGIPFFRVIDSGCPNFFDGKPITTAVGLGPARRDQVQSITTRFNLI